MNKVPNFSYSFNAYGVTIPSVLETKAPLLDFFKDPLKGPYYKN